uniref:Uncharacterized protein n=1 Tax=Arundo donax TaxID=35708 RepID=A0A0A9GZW5_ARUDO
MLMLFVSRMTFDNPQGFNPQLAPSTIQRVNALVVSQRCVSSIPIRSCGCNLCVYAQ